MAKNMTRKGLAAASTFALAVAGLVGIATPAAANTMVLEPSVGESNRVPVSETFALQTFHGAADNTYGTNVKVVISDPEKDLASVVMDTATTAAAYRTATNDWFVEGTNAAGLQTITLEPSGTDTFSVVVTTFIEPLGQGANNTPDTGETQQSIEVFFHNEDDYTWNLDFTVPTLAGDVLEASVSTAPALNLAQFAGNIEMGFATVASNGGLTSAADGETAVTSGDFTGGTAGDAGDVTGEHDVDISTDGNSIEFEVNVDDTANSDEITNATYAAGLLFAPGGSNKAEVSRKLAVVAEATVDRIDAPTAVGVNGATGGDGDEIIRKEASAVTISADVYAAYSGPSDNTPAAAGEEVTVTITDTNNSFTSDSVLLAGGETLTDDTTGNAISFTVQTDADGKVSFDVDASGVEADETFTVLLSSQGVDSESGAIEFQVKETAADDLVEHNLLGTDAEWKVEDGSYTIRFAALDNFGQPLTGDYRVVLSPVTDLDNNAANAYNSHTIATDEEQAASLSGGVATFTVNTTTADDDEVIQFNADLQKASGASFIDEIQETHLPVTIGASNAVADITVNSDGSGTSTGSYAEGDDFTTKGWDLATVEFASANGRLGEIFTDAGDLPSTDVETLEGSLKDASGLNTYGSVTFTADGLLFKTTGGGKDVYSVGSTTVQTGTDGDFAGVEVYSNQSGEQTVTVSSGSVSQDIVLEFDAAATTAGTNLVIDAPSAVEPGSTLVFDVTLTDDFGNPVSANATFNYDGPGFVVSEPSAITAGAARMTIFLGNNDDGKTGTLTVTYAEGDSALDEDLVVQKTVNIGDAPLAAGEFNAWTKLSDDLTNVKFYAKNPSNQGKIQFFFNGEEIAWHRGTSATSYEGGEPRYNVEQDAYYLVRDRDLVVGSQNVFEIYQDGERIWRAVKTID